MSELWLAVIFAVVWLMTFHPSWKLAIWLMSRSVSAKKITGWFWFMLVLYRVLIALPYIVVLLLGRDTLPRVVQMILVGLLLTGIVLSLFRFVFRQRVLSWLWNVYAVFYDGLLDFIPYQQLIKNVVATTKSVFDPSSQTVVELGCGTGNVLKALHDESSDLTYIGVDNSPTMLRIARQKCPWATLLQKDIAEYFKSLEKASVDIIVMQNSLYTLSDNDRVLLWQQMHEVLKDTGSVVITNSDKSGSSSLIADHCKQAPLYKWITPRLLIIGAIDALISQLSKDGVFHFVPEQQIKEEVKDLFFMNKTKRVYGNMNILFTLRKR